MALNMLHKYRYIGTIPVTQVTYIVAIRTCTSGECFRKEVAVLGSLMLSGMSRDCGS